MDDDETLAAVIAAAAIGYLVAKKPRFIVELAKIALKPKPEPSEGNDLPDAL